MGLTKREIGCPVTAAAESKFSYRTIANQSRCELYAAIRHLFKDVEITFYGKTGLPGRVVRHAVLDETGGVIYGPSGEQQTSGRLEPTPQQSWTQTAQTALGRTEKAAKISSDVYGAATTKLEAKKITFAKTSAKLIAKGVVKLFQELTPAAGSAAQITSDVGTIGGLDKNWTVPLESAIENLIEQGIERALADAPTAMRDRIAKAVNIGPEVADGGLKIVSAAKLLRDAVKNYNTIKGIDPNQILNGGPEIIISAVTKSLKWEIANRGASAVLETAKVAITIATFGAGHAALNLSAKVMDYMKKAAELCLDIYTFIKFKNCALRLGRMLLLQGGRGIDVSETNKATLRECLAESPLCAALIMGHPYVNYYMFLVAVDTPVITSADDDGSVPVRRSCEVYGVMPVGLEQTHKGFEALKSAARSYCKAVPHGFRHSDGTTQLFLHALMQGVKDVKLMNRPVVTAQQQVDAIANQRERFIAKIDRAIETYKGTVYRGNENGQSRKRDLMKNMFAKARTAVTGSKASDNLIKFIADQRAAKRDTKFRRYLGALHIAIPHLGLRGKVGAAGVLDESVHAYRDFQRAVTGLGSFPELEKKSRLAELLVGVVRGEHDQMFS
jgi:hypothetical protein